MYVYFCSRISQTELIYQFLAIYSQSVWFSALEIGLQLFALNLPSIWFLIRHISMGSIFKYLRSAVFLNRHYQRSNASRMKTYNEVLDDERSSN